MLPRRVRPLLLLLGAALLSCTAPEAPYVHIVEPLGLQDKPSLYVVANQHGERVAESLQASGIDVTSLRDANLLLRVRFGTSRRYTYECGDVQNLKYELRRENRLVLWIQGRGVTGKCPGNIVDEASVELAKLIAE